MTHGRLGYQTMPDLLAPVVMCLSCMQCTWLYGPFCSCVCVCGSRFTYPLIQYYHFRTRHERTRRGRRFPSLNCRAAPRATWPSLHLVGLWCGACVLAFGASVVLRSPREVALIFSKPRKSPPGDMNSSTPPTHVWKVNYFLSRDMFFFMVLWI